MSNRTSKLRTELLLPGPAGWQLWSGTQTGAFAKVRDFEAGPGRFDTASARRSLAFPASALWVLPAWLKGAKSEVSDMARLHLERLSVRTPEHAEAMQVDVVSESENAHLARIVALKDLPAPLADLTLLPDECRISAACYPIPADSLVVWRELGRLVVAITSGPRLVCFSALSAGVLDGNGMAELNNLCLQLTFQKVLTSISGIVLWIEDGDSERIQRTTGLPVQREDMPAPKLAGPAPSLMPMDVIDARSAAAGSARRRVMVLAGALVVAALIAGFSMLMGSATRERDALADRIAEISPRAAKVSAHKAAWMEVAAAVDPDRYPMELLLRCMEPKSSADVALTSFECTQDRVIIQGRTLEISPALKYTEDIKNSEALAAFTWDAATPTINNSDNSAAFELKGTLPGGEEAP